MKWLERFFKSGKEDVSAFKDGNELISALVDNNVNNRKKAAKVMADQGIVALNGLTPEGIAHGYARGSMLIMPVDSQSHAIIVAELMLRLLLCRTLIDDDQIVRTELAGFFGKYARSWAQKQIIKLNKQGQQVLKELGLTGPAFAHSSGHLSSRAKDFQLVLHSNTLAEKQNCIKCQKPITDIEDVWMLPDKFDFSEAIMHAASVLSTPGYVCRKCGSVICKGCLSVGVSDQACLKCGDKDMIHWSRI